MASLRLRGEIPFKTPNFPELHLVWKPYQQPILFHCDLGLPPYVKEVDLSILAQIIFPSNRFIKEELGRFSSSMFIEPVHHCSSDIKLIIAEIAIGLQVLEVEVRKPAEDTVVPFEKLFQTLLVFCG